MKTSKMQSPNLFSLKTNRINVFYILAIATLALVFYYSPFSAIIPIYGVLLIFLKNEKFVQFKQASSAQKILGIGVASASFFAYYGVILVYSGAAYYGAVNYAIYLLGLFLIFFEFSALREAFAPLFLIVAATSSALVSVWFKPFFSPFANDFALMILSILRAFGVRADIYYFSDTPMVAFTSVSGRFILASTVYECLGVYSALVFSIILVVILFEDPSSRRVKTVYSLVGFLGIFASNIVRVTTIFLVDYLYGEEVGATVHYVIGYALFSVWLVCFFYIYSRRDSLNARILSFWRKTLRTNRESSKEA